MPPIKHRFVSAKSDGADLTLVRPSSWNDDHLSAFEIRNARTDYGADATGGSNTAVAIQNALNALGLVILPTGSYRIDADLLVPDQAWLVCQPDAKIVCNGASVQFGSKTAQFWRTGGSVRVEGAAAAGKALVECYNLLGDRSLAEDQVAVTLSATVAASDLLHIHSTNAIGGAADVHYFISTANYLAGAIGLLLQNGDDAGIASVANDFINGNSIRGTIAALHRGIRLRGNGPVGGSVTGNLARNYFDRMDVNSFDIVGLDVFDAAPINNHFSVCTFEGTGGSVPIDSHLGSGQIFSHPIISGVRNIAVRDRWYDDESNAPIDDYGVNEALIRYVKYKNKLVIGPGFGARGTNVLGAFTSSGIGSAGRLFTQGEAEVYMDVEMNESIVANAFSVALIRSIVGVPANGGALNGGDVILWQSAQYIAGAGDSRQITKRFYDTVANGLTTGTITYFYIAYQPFTGGFAQMAANPTLIVNGGN